MTPARSYDDVMQRFITSPQEHAAVMEYLAKHYTALDREIADSPHTKRFVADLIDASAPNRTIEDLLRLALRALTMGVIIGVEMQQPPNR